VNGGFARDIGPCADPAAERKKGVWPGSPVPLVVAALTVGLAATTAAAAAGLHRAEGARLDRVLVIMLENHSEHSVIGDPNLIDELTAHHISWGAYMEALPADDPLTDFWPSSTDPLYASKHDPFALFTDIRDDPARVADIKPYTDLAAQRDLHRRRRG
jgi:hypothetical protein